MRHRPVSTTAYCHQYPLHTPFLLRSSTDPVIIGRLRVLAPPTSLRGRALARNLPTAWRGRSAHHARGRCHHSSRPTPLLHGERAAMRSSASYAAATQRSWRLATLFTKQSSVGSTSAQAVSAHAPRHCCLRHLWRSCRSTALWRDAPSSQAASAPMPCHYRSRHSWRSCRSTALRRDA